MKKTAKRARRVPNVPSSVDDILDASLEVTRDRALIRSEELVRRVRSIRTHASYVVRECSELLADLGADDVSNTVRRLFTNTFDSPDGAIAQRVDAGASGSFDEPELPHRRRTRGK